ncbi:MAG: sulfatase-like hydrolase/transferase [Chloroflexota bacterium]
MTRPERLLSIAQPLVFTAAVLLSRFAGIATTPGALIRPLIVGVAISGVTLVIARVLVRDWNWAALVSSLFILVTLREALPAGVLAGFVIWWLVIAFVRGRSGRRPLPAGTPAFVARASGIYSLAFLGIAAWGGWAASTSQPQVDIPAYSAPGVGGPNIYLLLLDGYPRADTLRLFGIDNEPFIHSLEDVGFNVSDNARSNYNKTWLTMASFLNGAYIEDLLVGDEIPADDAGQIRWLHSLMNEGSFIDLLRRRGYTIRTIPPPITSAALTAADDYVDNGHLTEFEASILWSSPWSTLFRDQVTPFFLSSVEATVTDGLATTVRFATTDRKTPQFVLSHVHSPHPPFALHAPGATAPAAMECFPATCSLWQSTIGELSISRDQYRAALTGQIQELDAAVLRVVRQMAEADPDAVIILMSDHGLRYSLEDRSEQFRSFLAVRSPGVESLFADDESPVNILRNAAAAYFGADLEALPYRAWWSDWAFTLRLTPFQPD